MPKLSKNYRISKLYIRETNGKKIMAIFTIDDIFYKLCLFGYSKQEQQNEEYDMIYYDEPGYQEYVDEFFELYRNILRKYVRMRETDKDNEFVKTVRKANAVGGIDLIEYRKQIRTAERIYS